MRRAISVPTARTSDAPDFGSASLSRARETRVLFARRCVGRFLFRRREQVTLLTLEALRCLERARRALHEDLLKRMNNLFCGYGAIIGACHSQNVLVCASPEPFCVFDVARLGVVGCGPRPVRPASWSHAAAGCCNVSSASAEAPDLSPETNIECRNVRRPTAAVPLRSPCVRCGVQPGAPTSWSCLRRRPCGPARGKVFDGAHIERGLRTAPSLHYRAFCGLENRSSLGH